MNLQNYTKLFTEKSTQVMEKFNKKLDTFSNIQAQPELLYPISLVDCYGAKTNIRQVANIIAADTLTLIIKPWDKHNIKNIEKAIAANSNLEVDTKTQGNELYVVFPPMSQERRETIAKNVKKTAEDFKISLRKVRTDILTQVKNEEKEKVLSKDDVKKITENMTKLTQDIIKKIDSIVAEKNKTLTKKN